MANDGIGEVENVWVRAFYGFNPEEAGYIGFTLEADRETMMARMADGDLVLIYGAVDDLTDNELKSQALGFLEIELERCVDRDRMSQSSIDWKIEQGFENRWTFGIKVRRAWRVNNRVHIRSVAPEAYQNEYRFERTTKAMLLTPAERSLALSHTVRQVNVFGEPPIAEAELGAGQIGSILTPSRGIVPSFGDRRSTYEDGENQIYLMIFSEPAQFVLGSTGTHVNQALVKIGRSNDPKRRMAELNGGFPSTAVIGWKLIQTHALPDGRTAHELETEIKAIFAEDFTSQAGEFFTGPEDAVKRAFDSFCRGKAPKILGAAGSAKGVKK